MHLIREDLTAVYARFESTDHVPVMGVTRDLPRSELNPLVFSVCHQLGPHWSPISCVLPRSR